jgi:hypothetical protein
MLDARAKVKNACDQAGVAFLDIVTPDNVRERLEDGVRVGAAGEEAARIGRQHSGREG